MTKLVLAALAALLLIAAPAQAAVFTVNRFDDPSGRISCPTTCSLRAALNAADNNQDATDTINLPAGRYSVSAQLGDLDVSSGISIIGAGADVTSIDGGGAVRVFHVISAQNRIVNVTISGGAALNPQDPNGTNGGNVVMEHGADLELNHVRVTRGVALGGGGVATGGGGDGLVILNSLIDNNEARVGTDGGGAGGGILLRSGDSPQSLTVRDSTIASNRAQTGGGLLVYPFGSNQTADLQRVTIADNTSAAGPSGIYSAFGTTTVQGSIVARNAPSNCGGAIVNSGGNVESGAECGFTNGRQNTSAGLATTLSMDGGFTPVLTIPINSVARDLAGTCRLVTDQRDVPRPQGAACDAGAYETLLTPPTTTILTSAPPFAFTTGEDGSTFECSLDGAAFSACSSPFNPSAAPGSHTLSVRATDRRGNVAEPATISFTVAQPQPQTTPTPTPTPSATPSPTPVPTPVVNKIVVVKVIKGTVKVKLPGKKAFEDLDTRGIPTGSEVDTRKGVVELTSVPTPGGTPQTARFYDGLFKVTQSRGITNLTLTEALAPCPKAGRAAAAAKKPKKRKLWGEGKGAFRTTGKYSAATVRGTTWLVEDSCAGTLTRVKQGAVTVRDKVKQKTIVLRAPKKYLARPKR